MSAVIEIENLRVEYSDHRNKNPKVAVEDFSLKVEEGEFFAFLGPNGAGKTSIITSMVGLTDFVRGKIRIQGFPAGSPEAKRAVGYVPQEVQSYGFFTVLEILHFISGYFGIRNNHEQIHYLLDRLQLTPHRDKLVSQLSGGMKRRLMIAKALVHRPRVLLLDEPSAGVDVELRQILWDFVSDLNKKEGVTILLTTHYLEEAERLCERLAILHLGQILRIGETKSIIQNLSERQLMIDFYREHLGAVPSVEGWTVHLDDSRKNMKIRLPMNVHLNEVFEKLHIDLKDVADLRTEEGRLEDAFLKLVRSGKKVA